VSLKRLEPGERAQYQRLAVFPADEPVPIAVAADLWGMKRGATRRLLVKLAAASLLDFNLSEGRIHQHDVLRTSMARSLGAAALRQAHADLIERWGDLQRLPDAVDPAYAWRWIGYHLREAGRQDQLDGLLVDLPWLQRKLEHKGIAALESEFAYASDQPQLQRLRRLLRNASHVLAAHPEQLPCQLLARWPRAQPGENAPSPEEAPIVAGGSGTSRHQHSHGSPDGWLIRRT
jgi:hypothetical protein